MSPLKQTVVLCDRFSTESIEKLKQRQELEVFQQPFRPDKEILRRADFLLIRSRTRIDADLLEMAPQLKSIVSATSGYDHIDLSSCRLKDLRVFYTPDANAQSAAEHTLLLILGTLRKSGLFLHAMKNRQWKDQCPYGQTLESKTLGVIGLGRVGSRVAKWCKDLGAKIVAYDPYQSDESFRKLSIERSGLTEVFAQSDILSLHTPLTKKTRHIINRQTLELVPHGVILVNAARGPLVDEGALIAALESGQVRAAGLDVYEHEPLAESSRLRQFPQAFLSPHIGAYTQEAFQASSSEAIECLSSFIESGKEGARPTDWDQLD